jgi:hypothetical protein
MIVKREVQSLKHFSQTRPTEEGTQIDESDEQLENA